MTKTILVADIGGTNSRFARFRLAQDGNLGLMNSKWLPTTGAGSFAQLLDQLTASDFSLAAGVDIAVLAVAGPVERDSYCAPPNIPWDIDLEKVRGGKLPRQARLINDFVAQAYACRSLPGLAAAPVLTGRSLADGIIGVLGAGTALGKATLAPLPGHGFLALPSEGGHACFPFVSEEEYAFYRFYQEKSGQNRITGNLVVSGPGLRHLHWFLSGTDLDPQQVSALLTEGKAAVTLAWAAKFFARICRDYALEALTLGGLYIAGGVASKNPGILAHENFRREFRDSPTMGHLLANIPVFLMDNQESGLWGAAFLGQQILQKRQGGGY